MSNTEYAYVAPRTPMEEALARIWAQVLDCESVGVKDHFQMLGGTSLHATRIFSRLRDDLGIKLSRSLILQFPTVEQMAVYIETYQPDSSLSAIAVLGGTQGRQEERNSSRFK